MSIDKGMYKEVMLHIYNGISFGHKKEILSYTTMWMNLVDILLNKQVVKGQILHASTCMRYRK